MKHKRQLFCSSSLIPDRRSVSAGLHRGCKNRVLHLNNLGLLQISEHGFATFPKYLRAMFMVNLFSKIMHDKSVSSVYSICS